jgi:NAD(P)-dependent dehydrogenase (short-subunit alcohol dehydrogenase family)
MQPVDWSLEGRVAIVTGAAIGGIGESYAACLAAAGAAVMCADIDGERAGAVAETIRADGGTAAMCAVDITEEDSVMAMVRATVDAFGGIDILVNNAALMIQIAATPAMQFTRADWDRAFAVNVTGAWNCARAVVPDMQQRGGGRIVNQSSLGAFPAGTVYGITKLALVGLTTTLAAELGSMGITVNCIAPGITESAAGKMIAGEGSPYREMLEAQAPGIAVGQPEDLCGTLLLLTTDAGRWINGQVIHASGGLVMRP